MKNPLKILAAVALAALLASALSACPERSLYPVYGRTLCSRVYVNRGFCRPVPVYGRGYFAPRLCPPARLVSPRIVLAPRAGAVIRRR